MEDKKTIAVVCGTIRSESMENFKKEWRGLFDKHNVEFITVVDGEDQHILVERKTLKNKECDDYYIYDYEYERVDIKSDLVSKFSAGCKQLGFIYILENLPDVEYIICLDDDVTPIGDPIQNHLNALNLKSPISWLSTGLDDYFRGFPYGVRKEAPVMLSHGVWDGWYDWDAPSQLFKMDKLVEFYKGIIPKGIYFPCCGMNIAFKREALPYVYFAPVGNFKGGERFDDIFMGIILVEEFAKQGWGIVTGYAKVNHLRSSNVFNSLEKEAVGIKHNEEFWKDTQSYKGHPWFDEYRTKFNKWKEYAAVGEKMRRN